MTPKPGPVTATSVGANSLEIAGRRIRREAKEHFDGDAEAAFSAASKLIENPEVLEEWATFQLNNEWVVDEDGFSRKVDKPFEAFRFSDLPTGLRAGAMEAMAVAYLADYGTFGEVVRVEFGSERS